MAYDSDLNDLDRMSEDNMDPETNTTTERSEDDMFGGIGSKGGAQRRGYQERADREEMNREDFEDS